jgi:hypothetical protein
MKPPEPCLGDALYPPRPARSGGESGTVGVPILGDAVRPAGDAPLAGDWVLGVALYPPRPMGTGDSLRGVALYPPRPMGAGCPINAGDPFLGVAL